MPSHSHMEEVRVEGAQFLLEYQSEFMFHEIQDKDADMTDAQL